MAAPAVGNDTSWVPGPVGQAASAGGADTQRSNDADSTTTLQLHARIRRP
jgi:hypothetical protein